MKNINLKPLNSVIFENEEAKRNNYLSLKKNLEVSDEEIDERNEQENEDDNDYREDKKENLVTKDQKTNNYDEIKDEIPEQKGN